MNANVFFKKIAETFPSLRSQHLDQLSFCILFLELCGPGTNKSDICCLSRAPRASQQTALQTDWERLIL